MFLLPLFTLSHISLRSAPPSMAVETAHRVVSLLPAATEAVCLVGGKDLLVARSHSDDFPPELVQLPAVTAARITLGSSKDIDDQVNNLVASAQELYELKRDILHRVKPSVIITQGLCTVCAISDDTVRAAAKELEPRPEVVSLSPMSLEDILSDIERIGASIGLEQSAEVAVAELRARVAAATARGAALVEKAGGVRPRVLFMEWTEPIFMGGHWTPQLIHMAGGQHPLNLPDQPTGAARPSFRIPPEEVVKMDPDIIIVCPCGFDIPTTLTELNTVVQCDWWKGLRAVQQGKVVLVDGSQMFNRSGPRVVDALEWLVALFEGHPEAGPKGFPWQWWKSEEAQ
ncbi:unnamed protein product [Closterium sp. Yama58-4]|nr:unnamed protein product [Closterium sp. Yama58-4]